MPWRKDTATIFAKSHEWNGRIRHKNSKPNVAIELMLKKTLTKNAGNA